jgi:branched-subunit amino acid aminotransferase/4-amino-4-deoxychorismate lyase
MTFTHQSINGQILPSEKALIPLTDLGMLRAYAIFDFFRVIDGVPIFLEDHLDRMFRSIALMEMPLSLTRAEVRRMVTDLIEVNHAQRAGFRIVVTGGFSEDGFTPGQPNIYMMLHELPVYEASDYENGCKLITSAYVRDMPMVKTCIYVQSLLVNKKMKNAGAVEVLYHWKGSITECSRSNIFFVTPEGTLVTPKEGMLQGITRKQVLSIAQEKGIPVELREVHLEELPWLKEAILTSSTRGVLPIVHIDDQRIGDGKPGEMTRMLHDAFERRVKEVIEKGQLVNS